MRAGFRPNEPTKLTLLDDGREVTGVTVRESFGDELP